MKMYRASWIWFPAIEEFEVEKVTEKTLTYKGALLRRPLRENKTGNGHAWFDTFDEAKAALITFYECKVRSADIALANAKDLLDKAKAFDKAGEPA